jgi:hypothetical protein
MVKNSENIHVDSGHICTHKYIKIFEIDGKSIENQMNY